nr:reverse transcriptase domain-containing protein [Tanacetum cinerariifolium]
MHARPRAVVAKAMRLGYYWPTMHKDARDMIQKCSDCQFADNPFKDWCDKLNITLRFASVKHPQSNRLVERANRSLGEGIKARLGEGNKNWVEELPYVLWAHRTMIKSSHGDTPFSLTYRTEAVIPAEIGMPTYRTAAADMVNNDKELRLNLDLLGERQELTAISEAKSKSKMIKYYNARVRGVAFKPGDFVYRSNDASHALAGGKLGPKWEGPYEVTEALGTVPMDASVRECRVREVKFRREKELGVLALEEAKTTQDKVITRLKLRVRRLEKKRKARTSQPIKRRLFKDKGSGEKGGSTDDQVSTARPEVSVATPSTPPTTTTIFGDEYLTIAQTLIKMRSEKAKEKGVAFRYVKEPPRLTRSTTTLEPLPTIDLKDKCKGVLVKEEPEKVGQSTKERQKQEEATIAALTEELDEIQARMDVDHELVHKTLEEPHMLYEREKKWIDDFVPMDSEKEEKKSVEPESKDKKGKRIKRVTDSALKQKCCKKQKMIQEQEPAKNEEETMDPEILSTKYPIVDWESQILKNVDMEDKHVYKIIRANGNTSYHKSLSSMLRKFNRQDLVDLHKLVMKRFEYNTPEGYNLLLWGDLKMLVEKRYPLIKEMLKKMLNWKLEAEAESTMAFELLKRDEKERFDHLKQDQTMFVIKRFSERKKVFSERKKTGKIRTKRMAVKEIEDVLLEEIEKFGWWFEEDIDGKSKDDNEKKLVMMNEE